MSGMRLRAPALIFAAMSCIAAAGAFAQQPHGERGARGGQGFFKGPQKMPPGSERRVVQPQGPDQRRPERMTPEDREKLRRDIDDANRGMERRR